jgi:hypothetical protein
VQTILSATKLFSLLAMSEVEIVVGEAKFNRRTDVLNFMEHLLINFFGE